MSQQCNTGAVQASIGEASMHSPDELNLRCFSLAAPVLENTLLTLALAFEDALLNLALHERMPLSQPT